MSRSYQLTHDVLATHLGGQILCLDPRAIGQTMRAYARRPGPARNERITRAGIRSEVIVSDGSVVEVATSDPSVQRVDICGAIEQTAGQHEPSGSWCDGHDAITERMCCALEIGNVVMVINSPGGSYAGLAEGVRRVGEAKQRLGRRIIAYANEQMGSAAVWWACVADAIYLPTCGKIGSIGAMAGHESVAGAMKKAGVEPTFFTWPSASKVGLAPQLPLSETAKSRAERDTVEAGLMFAAAVASARGISVEYIETVLDADVLTGQAAVDAGLADGVATLEEVLEMALTQTEEDTMSTTRAGETYEKTIKERYESSDEETPDEPETPEEEMSDDDEEDEDDKAPPMAAKRRASAPAKAAAPKTLASLAGLREGASLPAILSVITPKLGAFDRACRALGVSTAGEFDGAIKSAMTDLAELGRVRSQNVIIRKRAAGKERVEILDKLVALGVYAPGEAFEVVMNADQTAIIDRKPAEAFGTGPRGRSLENLRGELAAKQKSAPTVRSSPFEPDHKTLSQAGAGVTDLDRRMAERNGLKPEDVTSSRLALFPNGVRA